MFEPYYTEGSKHRNIETLGDTNLKAYKQVMQYTRAVSSRRSRNTAPVNLAPVPTLVVSTWHLARDMTSLANASWALYKTMFGDLKTDFKITTGTLYSETSIYRSRIIRFPGSIIQFLWSLSESNFNYGSRIVSFSDPDENDE
jgi:hypothetical protein